MDTASGTRLVGQSKLAAKWENDNDVTICGHGIIIIISNLFSTDLTTTLQNNVKAIHVNCKYKKNLKKKKSLEVFCTRRNDTKTDFFM